MSETERAITHTAYAEVARLMGYTVQGLTELCDACAEWGVWRTFGATRKGVTIDGSRGPHRVAVMVNPANGRFVFSVGPNAYQLTENARAARKAREQMANSIVSAINASRDPETRSIVAAAKRTIDRQAREAAEKAQVREAHSGPETMIIYPVAPRDPRGI